MPSRAGLFDRIMRPKSVAVIGMSTRADSLSQAVLRNLQLNEFGGDLYLIGRNAAEVDGLPIRAGMSGVPDGIDVAVLAVPAAGVGSALADCVERRVGAAVVFASGFAEAGERERDEQDRLTQLARDGGVAVIGPNCLGYANYRDGFNVAFAAVAKLARVPAGTRDAVAILSQSGGLGAHLRLGLQARGITLSYTASTGNEMDLGLADFVDFLAGDDATRVVCIYAEHVRRPAEFLAAARRVRAAGKAVVLLHSGRGARAQAAAKSHTGALAGDYAVMRVHVERAGVLLVDTLDELLDATELLARFPAPSRGGLGIVTLSGAYCGLAHDFCEQTGIPVPPPAAATIAHLTPLLPDFIAPNNPLDLGTQPLWQPELLRIGIEALLADPAIGAVAVSISPGNAATANIFIAQIIAARESSGKPLALAILGDEAPLPPEFVQSARDNHLVLSHSSDRTLRAMGAVLRWSNRPESSPPSAPQSGAGARLAAGTQPEWSSKLLLAAAGIAVPPGRLARTPDEAVAIAAEIGFPVAMKAQAAALAHKTEAGGVLLGVADAAAVRAGWSTLANNVERAQPGLALDGMLVEAMARRGLELVAGARRDPHWGAVVLVGLGGVLVEALDDVRLVAVDAAKDEIVAELEQLKAAKLLHGFRSQPAVDVDAVAEVAMVLGALMRTRPEIVEIDVNPLVAHPRGEGATAVDALIVTA